MHLSVVQCELRLALRIVHPFRLAPVLRVPLRRMYQDRRAFPAWHEFAQAHHDTPLPVAPEGAVDRRFEHGQSKLLLDNRRCRVLLAYGSARR